MLKPSQNTPTGGLYLGVAKRTRGETPVPSASPLLPLGLVAGRAEGVAGLLDAPAVPSRSTAVGLKTVAGSVFAGPAALGACGALDAAENTENQDVKGKKLHAAKKRGGGTQPLAPSHRCTVGAYTPAPCGCWCPAL